MTMVPKFLVGGCSAGEWPWMKVKDQIQATKGGGCNCIGVLEAMAPCFTEDGYNRSVTIEDVWRQLSAWLTAAQDAGLFVILHLTNANDETLEDSPEYSVVYGLEKCKWLVNQLAQNFTGNVVLCPVAEEKGTSTEQALIQHCIAVWHDQHGGLLSTTGGGRVGSANPTFAVIDYHTQSRQDFGPTVGPNQRVLLDSDNSVMNNSLRAGAPAGCYYNPESVLSFGYMAASQGKWTNLYIPEKVIDVPALAALGKAYKGKATPVKKPQWYDKVWAWIKGLLGM